MSTISYDPRLYAPFGLSSPPEEYYLIPDGEDPDVMDRVRAWEDRFNKAWNWLSLGRYLASNNKTCQELTDDELNSFRRV